MAFLHKRNNTYYVYWYENRKQKAQPVGQDYISAHLALDKKRLELAQRKSGAYTGVIQWQSYCQEYLEYSKTNKEPATYNRDRITIQTFNKLFKIERLTDITATTLESFKAKRQEKGIMPNSINRELITLKAMLNRAEKLSYIARSPSNLVKYVKVPQKKLRFLSKQEYKRLIQVSYEPFTTAIILSVYTGMRAGEVRWLTWQDIDFKRKLISVTHKEGWKPKDNEIRHIPICNDLLLYIKGLKRKEKWVVCYSGGEQVDDQTFCQMMRRIFNKAGLKDCSSHTLRHTFASWLRLKGVNLDVIAELLGHTKLETTQIYAHITPTFKQNVINLLNS